jgi:transposase
MKTTTPPPSYEGSDVYIGIDVHKKTYVAVARVGQVVVKKWTTPAEPEAFAQQLLKYFAGAQIHTVYEASFCGFRLHRELRRQEIDNIVVHAAGVEVAANRRVKTDKRDADKLSGQLACGRLKGITIPSEAQEKGRLLSRTRSQLVKHRRQIMQQIRMKSHQFGLIAPEEQRVMSLVWVQQLLEQSSSEEFRVTVSALVAVWQTLDQQIGHLQNQLHQQAAEDPCHATYLSAPGFGLISARILANELGNLSRFANERQLFSLTGLTPSEHSSGEQVQRGGITKQGNRHVRAVLIEVSWRAIRQDPDLAAFYQRILMHSDSKRAIVAVARKLIGRIRAAFCRGEHYRMGESPEVALEATAKVS